MSWMPPAFTISNYAITWKFKKYSTEQCVLVSELSSQLCSIYHCLLVCQCEQKVYSPSVAITVHAASHINKIPIRVLSLLLDLKILELIVRLSTLFSMHRLVPDLVHHELIS